MKKLVIASMVVLGMVVGVLGMNNVTQATQGHKPPKGNNGTIKVHEQGTPSGTESNDPKSCVFNIEGFGFDPGQTGFIKFDVQGNDAPHGTPAGPFAFGPTDANGYYASQYFNLTNGHYKVTLYGKDLKDKSKVFKINCEIPVDVCPNLEGNQAVVPRGMIKDEAGNCVDKPTRHPEISYDLKCDVTKKAITVTVKNTGNKKGYVTINGEEVKVIAGGEVVRVFTDEGEGVQITITTGQTTLYDALVTCQPGRGGGTPEVPQTPTTPVATPQTPVTPAGPESLPLTGGVNSSVVAAIAALVSSIAGVASYGVRFVLTRN